VCRVSPLKKKQKRKNDAETTGMLDLCVSAVNLYYLVLVKLSLLNLFRSDRLADGLLRATISAQPRKAGGGVLQGASRQAPGRTTWRQRAAARLFRCSLRSRVEKKLAHLARRIA
jgi:hypothetical protein